MPSGSGSPAWRAQDASTILALVPAVPVALTIAGSDSSGGAGIQADLLTFAAFGVHGASAVTALTAQNTTGVRGVLAVEPAFVAQQIDAVLDDLDVHAAKTGMLLRAEVVEAVAERLGARPVPHLVVDPVMVATSGAMLLEEAAITALRERLVPLAALVTPNLREAEVLTGRPVTTPAEMRAAAHALVAMGARAALVKGGHLSGDASTCSSTGASCANSRRPHRDAQHTRDGCALGGDHRRARPRHAARPSRRGGESLRARDRDRAAIATARSR
jgi:hydroxymethylpyrimidine/phosphomethylpyrimidine kinase